MPVISTNTAANTALRYLNENSAEQSDALGKIASGSRINKASDDAAGLAIGVRLETDVDTLTQAETNAAQGSALLQTADGGLTEISDILQRQKSLATQALSGAITDSERTYLNAEYSALLTEIDSIASATRFNGESLLDGGDGGGTDYSGGVSFLAGTDAADTITVSIAAATTTALGINGGGITTTTAAGTALTAVDTAIDTVSGLRASVGAQMSQFEYRSGMIATSIENLDAAASTIMDADVAYEQTRLASAEVKTDAAVAALAQANELPSKLLQLLQ